MPQFAVAYAPNYNGGAITNTTTTGSFRIGTMVAGRGPWNQTLTQTTTNTFFCASPNDATAYVIAIPNPSPSAPFNGTTAPQFFYSLLNGVASKTDGAFIATCSYILRNYKSDGTTGTPKINGAGCSSVTDCQNQINTVGWQSYGFINP